MSTISSKDRILGRLWGSLVGDAIGVPVEFKDRVTLQTSPVQEMRGFGSHQQPPGTWSDDGTHHLDHFVNALGMTISVGGDCDTNAAIVGGIIAVSVGREKIPSEWFQARESVQL